MHDNGEGKYCAHDRRAQKLLIPVPKAGFTYGLVWAATQGPKTRGAPTI